MIRPKFTVSNIRRTDDFTNCSNGEWFQAILLQSQVVCTCVTLSDDDLKIDMKWFDAISKVF